MATLQDFFKPPGQDDGLLPWKRVFGGQRPSNKPATTAPSSSSAASPGFQSQYSGGGPGTPWMRTLNPSTASSLYAPSQPSAGTPSTFAPKNPNAGPMQGPRGRLAMMM